ERRLSSSQRSTASLPLSEHEHGEHKLAQSYGSGKIDLESPEFNEHEVKHDFERRLSSGQVSTASLPLTKREEHETQQHPKEDDHEPQPSSRTTSTTSHEEIEPEDKHKLTPKSSIGQLSTHSAQLSEHEVEETRSTPERKTSIGRLSTESSPTVEHKDYEHEQLPSHTDTSAKSDEETEEEEHPLQQSFVSDKSNVESSHVSEHGDEEHHIISSKPASIVQTPEQERRFSSGKVSVASLPLIQHEVDHQRHHDADHFQRQPSSSAISVTSHEEIEPEHVEKLTPKSSIGKLSTESLQYSEHEDEEHHIISSKPASIAQTPDHERRLSSSQRSIASLPISEHEDHEVDHRQHHHADQFQRQPSSSAISVTSHEDIESEHVEKVTPQFSEHEDEEVHHSPERKVSIDEVLAKSSPTVEHKDYQHEQLSTQKDSAARSDEEIEEEEHELQQSFVSEKSNVESTHMSEHEDEEHHIIRSKPDSVVQTPDNERRFSSGKISTASLPLSEHEDEEARYSPERKLSTGRVSVESSPTVEHTDYQHEHLPTHQDTSAKSDDEIEEEEHDHEPLERSIQSRMDSFHDVSEDKEDVKVQYDFEQKLSKDQTHVESPSEAVDQLERKRSVDSVVSEPHRDSEHEEEQYEHNKEEKPAVEDEFQLERKLSSEKLVKESEEFSEDEHKLEPQLSSGKVSSISPRTSERDEDEDHYQRQISADQVSTQSSHKTEEERFHERDDDDDVIIETSQETEEDKTKQDDEVKSKQKLSNVKFMVSSAPSSEEEEKESEKGDEETEQQYHFQHDEQNKAQHKTTSESSDENQEDSFKRRISTGDIPVQSSHESEHEDEEDLHAKESITTSHLSDKEEQYQSEHKQRSETEENDNQYQDDFDTEEPYVPDENEQDQHSRFSTSDKASIGSDRQIEEEKPERKLSSNQVVIKSSHESEHEEEEDDKHQKESISSTHQSDEEEQYHDEHKLERQSSVDKSEQKQDAKNIEYERLISAGQVALSFPQQSEEDQYEQSSITEENERELSDDGFVNLESSSVHEQTKRSQEWTHSSFQRDEIYGDKYRPAKYALEPPDLTDIQHTSDSNELEPPVISHIQRSSIISRTIPSYQDEEELEHSDETDFRPTHLDISVPDETEDTSLLSNENNQYEKVLIETSNSFVNQILNDAVNETIEHEKNYSLYQTATGIVTDVMDNIYTKYDDEILSSQREEATSADVSISDLTDWSSLVRNTPDLTIQEQPLTISSNEIELNKEEYLTSDDEEKDKLPSHITDEPYLSGTDINKSKSTHEIHDLVQDLQTFEREINDNVDVIRSSSPSSSSSQSDNDEIHHYDLELQEKIATPFNNEATNLISELQTIEEKFDHLQHEENLPTTTDVDTLSRSINQYRRESISASDDYSHHIERRPSSPPTSPLRKEQFVHITCSSMNDVDQVQQQLQNEHEETQVLQDMIDTIIKQAQEHIQSNSLNVPQLKRKSIPTILVDERRVPYIQSSATSISDELDLSHEDSTGDRSTELAAQLDYLRRMSRYEHLMDEQHHIETVSLDNNQTIDTDAISQTNLANNRSTGVDDEELLSSNYLTITRDEEQQSPSSDEHEEEDEDKEKKKKRKSTPDDDHKSLSEHHDSDDDDDNDDHKGDKPLISTNIQETIQSEPTQQSTPTDSNEKQTQQQEQKQQEMEMSRDSISELMLMSQDSLKHQRSFDSLDSDQEIKLLSSNTSQIQSNEIDDFLTTEHQSEPTPSRMMTNYVDDTSNNNIKSTNEQYPLISNEIDIGQLPVIHARRTASENSLFSTSSSSLHMYDGHSLSTSCLMDKDDLTPSNEYIDYQQQMLYDDSQKNQQIYRETTRTDDDDNNNNNDDMNNINVSTSPSTSSVGFFDRVKAFVTKPVEIVQEAMENRRKQRSTSSLNSNTDTNEKQSLDNEHEQKFLSSSEQHFHSVYDLHDEDQNQLVHSPELYNMNNLSDKTFLPHLHVQNRTQSESALTIDNTKRGSLVTTSNDISEEYLPAISKDNSLEFMYEQQHRLSTPYDDVMEKESSPEHSDSYNLPTTAFLDTFEPTSSSQRPLALSVPGQQSRQIDETMTEEEFDILTTDYVNQVLYDVVAKMGGDQDDSSHSNKSDKLSDNDTSSDDEDEDEQKQNQIPTDTSSFGFTDRYSADESSNTREHTDDEDHSARSSTTATPTKNLRHSHTDTEILNIEKSSNISIPTTIQYGSPSDTGTFHSAISPSSGADYIDVHSTLSTVDGDDKSNLQPPTQSNSSQYLTANDETPNFLTSDDNEYAEESGTINYSYNDSSSDEKFSNENRSNKKYSGEGEESSSGNQDDIQRRKRSNEQRESINNNNNTTDNLSTKTVSFKLDLNDNALHSPRSSTSIGFNINREESVDSPIDDSNEKNLIKNLQEEILRTNLETLKNDLELPDNQIYSSSIVPQLTTTTTTNKTIYYSDYDAGSESDRDSTLVDSLKSTIQTELNDIYNEKESLIDKIKLKFERSLDRLIEKTLSGDDDTNKSDLISPFTDTSLNRSLPASEHTPTTMMHAHSEQTLQACPDELDYGTLQRFSSDSCIIIRVPEQYTPSSTLFFDQLKNEQLDQKIKSNQTTSAFSFYSKQEHQQQQQQQPQPSSSPIEMLTATTTENDTLDNISPINRYTPRSLDDSSLDFGERDMTDMSDEFVLVKNISPSINTTKEVKRDTPSNSSSSSSDKHESPDLIDILQHQCDYPPLDTGFDLRSGTTLETVYESPELRNDDTKSVGSVLSLTTADILRPFSTEYNSSNTPNTDDSLMEFERIEMELLRNSSLGNVNDVSREIRSSVDSLIQQNENNTNKVESFIEKHFPSIDNDVQNVLNDILDMTGDLTHSISSQSDATTVIERSQHHSIDDDFVQVTHEDIENQEKNRFSSDDDLLHNQTTLSSHDKRRLSAPIHDQSTRRIKTPSSSSSSSSSFSSTSRSVIYSQQHSQPQQRILQAETDLSSFRQQQQTQSATDLPFLPPFVNTNPTRTKKHSSSVSTTPSHSHVELSSGNSKKKTHSHPGSLGGNQIPPQSSLNKEGMSSSQLTSMSSHSSSSSHHSDDCYCTDPTTTSHQH
ncbi:unnamed protein product, partial [Adineta steineri]